MKLKLGNIEIIRMNIIMGYYTIKIYLKTISKCK